MHMSARARTRQQCVPMLFVRARARMRARACTRACVHVCARARARIRQHIDNCACVITVLYALQNTIHIKKMHVTKNKHKNKHQNKPRYRRNNSLTEDIPEKSKYTSSNTHIMPNTEIH